MHAHSCNNLYPIRFPQSCTIKHMYATFHMMGLWSWYYLNCSVSGAIIWEIPFYPCHVLPSVKLRCHNLTESWWILIKMKPKYGLSVVLLYLCHSVLLSVPYHLTIYMADKSLPIDRWEFWSLIAFHKHGHLHWVEGQYYNNLGWRIKSSSSIRLLWQI